MSRILIVNQSRVIRATLTRHFQEHYQVVEELDGESAWQTLVLDHQIVAVVAGIELPQLDGMSLLERLRANRLHRLKTMPFFFIGSENKLAELGEPVRILGASDFIVNGMGKWEILPLIRKHLPGANNHARPQGKSVHFRESGLLSPVLVEEGVRRVFAGPGDMGSILVFGIDHFNFLTESLGPETAERIADKLAHLVKTKIGSSDFMGQHTPGRFVIVSRGSRLEQCEHFAKRVAKSLAGSQITVKGHPVKVTVSVGVASRPDDGNLSGEALLTKAVSRMEQAAASGGNQVIVHDLVRDHSMATTVIGVAEQLRRLYAN